MLSSLNLLDEFFDRRPSVYVVSDSQLAAWKRARAEEEIIQLNSLIDSHKQSIERLENTISELRKEYPLIEPTTEKDA